MVVEHAARRFSLPCALKAIDAGCGAHVLVENARVGKDLFDLLNAVEHLDQPRMVIVEGTRDRSGGQLLELGEFLLGFWRAHGLDDVQPRQRSDAIAISRSAPSVKSIDSSSLIRLM